MYIPCAWWLGGVIWSLNGPGYAAMPRPSPVLTTRPDFPAISGLRRPPGFLPSTHGPGDVEVPAPPPQPSVNRLG